MHMLPEAVYILNRRVYKESSLILDIFSLNYGRLSIVANGVLKNKKSLSALLQVFQPLMMAWRGNSSLKTLVSVEAPSPAIHLNGKRLFSAYYLNELLLKLIPQDQGVSASFNYSVCFVNYAKTLEDLVNSQNIELPLRRFEYQLLTELGVFPDVHKDLDGHDIDTNLVYQLIPQEGFRISKSSSSYSSISGHHLTELFHLLDEDFVFSSTFMLQVKGLMRTLISDILGGKELKSRALFKTYKPFRRIK